MATAGKAKALLEEIRACTVCAGALKAGPRPVVQFAGTARLVIIGQAPGARVHASGVPWDDPSGQRLRDWTGLTETEFYDPAKVALVPMGFCYPGKGTSGDLPPRPECAPLWHERIFGVLKEVRLTLLVGSYAQAGYLERRGKKKPSLTEAVRDFRSHGPALFPLPHPSWRSGIWMSRNPWFEAEVLPVLRSAVRKALSQRS
jgi:uracil-DNA glycosylase